MILGIDCCMADVEISLRKGRKYKRKVISDFFMWIVVNR